jgi:hypothetical protein
MPFIVPFWLLYPKAGPPQAESADAPPLPPLPDPLLLPETVPLLPHPVTSKIKNAKDNEQRKQKKGRNIRYASPHR